MRVAGIVVNEERADPLNLTPIKRKVGKYRGVGS